MEKKRPIILKPILKKTRKVNEDISKHNVTKKVVFPDEGEDEDEDESSNMKKTRKKYPSFESAV